MRRGFFRPAECPRRSALRSCYDYVLGLCGRMKDVAEGGLWSLSLFRGFAAKPRVTLGCGEDRVAAVFCPLALGLAAFLELIYIP